MRFFIALEVPEENRQEINLIQERLKQLIPEVRLTDYHKLHLTLAFIGDHDQSLKADLVEIINLAALDIPHFVVTPAYMDAFPKLHDPHTFWLGVKGDVDKLFLLEERLKDQLLKIKLEVDNRRYIPHIAIGKIPSYEIDETLEAQLEDIVINSRLSPISIAAIKLFESIPSGDFHEHNTLAEIQLS